MISKPAGQKCPHLSYQQYFQKEIAVCNIHHLPCYKETPCEQFEQFGPQDSVCMMGWFLSRSPEKEKLRKAVEFQK